MPFVGIKRSAVGVIDGVNATFATPTPYVTGSLRVFLNGQLISGFAESAGALFTTEFPPELGDEVAVYYREAL